MDGILHLIRDLAVYESNGALAILYTMWEHAAAVLVLAGTLHLLHGSPEEQRTWVAGVGVLAFLAALFSEIPVPAVMAAMVLAGVGAVRLDRFNPDNLRWRIVGGVALYALAGLGYLAYSAYLDSVSAEAWAQAIGGQGEAMTTLAQGQAFVNTLATWGLWLIVPLGYFSLLAQSLLVHPPSGVPRDVIAAVRTRGITVVLVTHEPAVARHTQRIIHLKDGLVIEEETVEPPLEARELGIEEGDYMEVSLKEGVIVISPAQVVDRSQAYFWSKRWQQEEREADEDIKTGRVRAFEDADSLTADLDS